MKRHHHEMVSFPNQNSADSTCASEAPDSAVSSWVNAWRFRQSLVSEMFYAARWQQRNCATLALCVTSREGSWSACATFIGHRARPRWPARGRERTAWSRDSFRNRKIVLKIAKKRFTLFKEKLSFQNKERKILNLRQRSFQNNFQKLSQQLLSGTVQKYSREK